MKLRRWNTPKKSNLLLINEIFITRKTQGTGTTLFDTIIVFHKMVLCVQTAQTHSIKNAFLKKSFVKEPNQVVGYSFVFLVARLDSEPTSMLPSNHPPTQKR